MKVKLPVNCVVVTVLSGLNPCMCHAGIEALQESVHDRCGAHFYDRPFLFHQVLTGCFFLSVTLSVDCKTVGFFLKISKEIGKAWRKSLTRAQRASLTVGRVRREKKNRLSVFHTTSSFRPGGSKMSSSCQKSVHSPALFVNLIHSVIGFEGE